MQSSTWITHWMIGTVLTVAIAAGVVVIFMMNRTGDEGSGLSDEFKYTINGLGKTDPALILYREVDAIDGGLEKATAIAVGPGNTLYVAGDKMVRILTKPIREIPLDGEPTSITVDDNGVIYVGLRDHIVTYNGKGKVQARFESAGPDARITSLGVSNGVVYAAEFSKRVVLRYDTAGKKLGSMGDFVIPSPYFDLAVSENGFLLVTNTGEHRVETYSLNGDLVTWWGEFSNTEVHGFCGCCNPVNIALLPGGAGVVTCEKGITRVKVFDRDGIFQGLVAGTEQFARHDSLLNSPDYDYFRVGLDVAVDDTGKVHVLDPATGEIRVFVRGEKK